MLPHLADRAFRLMAAAPVPGCLVEFGVYQGHGLCALARLARRYLPSADRLCLRPLLLFAQNGSNRVGQLSAHGVTL